MATILLVDDDPVLLQNLRYILEQQRHTVLSATSAEAALAVCHQCPQTIDVLISDMMLESMNGAELAAAMRVQHPLLAVILISGSSAQNFPDRTIADRFLEKPFSHAEMIEAIDEASKESASRKN